MSGQPRLNFCQAGTGVVTGRFRSGQDTFTREEVRCLLVGDRWEGEVSVVRLWCCNNVAADYSQMRKDRHSFSFLQHPLLSSAVNSTGRLQPVWLRRACGELATGGFSIAEIRDLVGLKRDDQIAQARALRAQLIHALATDCSGLDDCAVFSG